MARKTKQQSRKNGPVRVHLGIGGEELIKATIKANDKMETIKLTSILSAYAAPSFWGPSVTVASHIGSVSYSIAYEAVGETLVLGRVRYWKGAGGGQ